jgi:hypothetical protein
MNRILVRLSAVVLVSVSATASAFNDNGHRLVALIAYELLDPYMQAKSVELLTQHPRFAEDFLARMPDSIRDGTKAMQNRWIFSQASIWPDHVKGFRGDLKAKYDRRTWHYVNLPIFLSDEHRRQMDGRITNNLDQAANDQRPEDQWNVIQALLNSSAILENKKLTAQERAVHLCWIAHLVGDSHQPLHSSALFTPRQFPIGDLGGNRIPLEQGSLHGLWDRLLGRGQTLDQIHRRASALLANDDLHERGEKSSLNMKFASWIEESHDLADQSGYHQKIRNAVARAESSEDDLKTIELPNSYFLEAGQIARRRAVEAGFRLATLVERSMSR